MKTLILFIVLLSVIALIHEFGHYIAAKIFGVYVQEFSVGMGPKIFQIKGKETKYSFRAILLGGYVALAGDNNGEQANEEAEKLDIPKNRTLPGVHPAKRIVIMLAGIFMNFVLAILIVSIILMSVGKTTVSPKPIIAAVEENYPAYEAGIKEGDLIKKITLPTGTSSKPKDFQDVSYILQTYSGEEGNIVLTIDRDGEILNINVKPILVSEEDGTERYVIGISSLSNEIVDITFFNSFYYAIKELWSMTKILLVVLLGLFRGVGMNNLSGPIGIYSATDQIASYGFSTYMYFMGTLSLNVGIMNALPIPLFDGGRVVLTIIEWITKKPINKKVENIAMIVSIALVLLLFICATYQDILRLF